MNHYDYLKKKFPFYILCGSILGIILFFIITISRYNSNLMHSLSDLNNISSNKSRILKEMREVDAIGEYLKEEHHMDIASVDTDLFIFQAVDDMKTALQEAVITVSGFEKAPGRQELPVSIIAPVENYNMILDYVHYIESFRIPDYVIKNITIVKEEMGRVILNIKGSFIMPLLESQA